MLVNVFTWMANDIILTNSIYRMFPLPSLRIKNIYYINIFCFVSNIIKQALVNTILYIKYNIAIIKFRYTNDWIVNKRENLIAWTIIRTNSLIKLVKYSTIVIRNFKVCRE